MVPVGSKVKEEEGDEEEEEEEDPPVLRGPTVEEELKTVRTAVEVVVLGPAVPPVLIGPRVEVDEVELAKGG